MRRAASSTEEGSWGGNPRQGGGGGMQPSTYCLQPLGAEVFECDDSWGARVPGKGDGGGQGTPMKCVSRGEDWGQSASWAQGRESPGSGLWMSVFSVCESPLFLGVCSCGFLWDRMIPCGLTWFVLPLGGQFSVRLCLVFCLRRCVCTWMCVTERAGFMRPLLAAGSVGLSFQLQGFLAEPLGTRPWAEVLVQLGQDGASPDSRLSPYCWGKAIMCVCVCVCVCVLV